MPRHYLLVVLICLLGATTSHGGLYYSGETVAPLPAQWRGFLLDQRSLRMIAVKSADPVNASPLRARYLAEAKRLEEVAKKQALSADEAADLGAILIRLGELDRALDVLQSAQRTYPKHFRLTANLGTAWHMRGDLGQASTVLRQSVQLAPGKWQKAEQLHLDLVQQRRRQAKDALDLDNLFGVKWVGPDGKYRPGALAAEQRKLLPTDAMAQAQLLALWLPHDPLLLWQLAELANAHGDVITAAAMMDGCVTEFGLRAPLLREHRQLLRAAADARLREPSNKELHDSSHTVLFQPRSSRPLVSKLDLEALPAIAQRGINPLPWPVLTESVIERPFRPRFPRYLEELEGKQVEMRGFMQPLGEDTECAAFLLIEFPVGCWYCEMPELTAMVRVELPGEMTQAVTRSRLRVTGELVLNRKDPERFLYTIKSAKVAE